MAEESNQKETFEQKIGIYKGEFGKITWPTKEEMVKQTITVIISCAIIAAIIFGMDFVLREALNLLIGFLV